MLLTSSFQRVVIVTYVALPSIPKAAVGEQMSEEQPSSNREGPARQPTGSNPGGPKPFWRRTPFLMVVPPLALVMIITVVGCVSSSSTSSPTASSSASAQASQPSGSPSASAGGSPPTQANPAFPYEPGGVTYSGGVGGGVDTFSIPAGSYSENTQASYDPANDPSDTGESPIQRRVRLPVGQRLQRSARRQRTDHGHVAHQRSPSQTHPRGRGLQDRHLPRDHLFLDCRARAVNHASDLDFHLNDIDTRRLSEYQRKPNFQLTGPNAAHCPRWPLRGQGRSLRSRRRGGGASAHPPPESLPA